MLHHPDFDPNEVDHHMHKRVMTAIEEGDLQVIDLKEDGFEGIPIRPVYCELTCYIRAYIPYMLYNMLYRIYVI